MSQADYYLKVDGAPGESGDDKHKNEIECLSFDFGVTQTGSSSYGKGLGAGKGLDAGLQVRDEGQQGRPEAARQVRDR